MRSGSNFVENIDPNLVTKWFLDEDFYNRWILAFINSKFNKFDNGRSDCILIFKRFISYHSDSSSSEEEMSQFIKTDEIYGEVAKIIDGLLTNFYRLRNPLQCVKYFNLNVHSCYKNQFFVWKFLFIKAIDSIYLIFRTKYTSPFADVFMIHKRHNTLPENVSV